MGIVTASPGSEQGNVRRRQLSHPWGAGLASVSHKDIIISPIIQISGFSRPAFWPQPLEGGPLGSAGPDPGTSSHLGQLGHVQGLVGARGPGTAPKGASRSLAMDKGIRQAPSYGCPPRAAF